MASVTNATRAALIGGASGWPRTPDQCLVSLAGASPPLELIEVQIGSYLGEDDIVRSDDVYHRGPDETR